MAKYELTNLCDKLISENKNVLILDTCCLLDIVRVPSRNSLDTLIAGQQILGAINQNEFNLVIPSLVEEEWTDNIATVTDESRRCIVNHHNNALLLLDIAKNLAVSQVTLPDLASLDMEVMLRTLSKDLLDSGLHLSEDAALVQKAARRAMRKIPPAQQGKDSLKDCVIYEETLALGKELRSQSFMGKIVFASSNTKEYDNDAIKQELARIRAMYVSKLPWALYEVK